MPNETTTPTYITIHTDGACLNNPGVGGWAVAIRRISNGETLKKRLLHGAAPSTTNNRMELYAAISGLKPLQRVDNTPVLVFSDSKYLVEGMSLHLPRWIENNWRSAQRKAIKNVDLWQELHALAHNLQVDWQWIKAQNGDPHTEEVGHFANLRARELANSPLP